MLIHYAVFYLHTVPSLNVLGLRYVVRINKTVSQPVCKHSSPEVKCAGLL